MLAARRRVAGACGVESSEPARNSRPTRERVGPVRPTASRSALSVRPALAPAALAGRTATYDRRRARVRSARSACRVDLTAQLGVRVDVDRVVRERVDRVVDSALRGAPAAPARAATASASDAGASAPQQLAQALEVLGELLLQPPLDDRDEHPRGQRRRPWRRASGSAASRRRSARARSALTTFDAVGLRTRLGAAAAGRTRVISRSQRRGRRPTIEHLVDARALAERAADSIALRGRSSTAGPCPASSSHGKTSAGGCGRSTECEKEGTRPAGYPPAGLGPRAGRSGTTSAGGAGLLAAQLGELALELGDRAPTSPSARRRSGRAGGPSRRPGPRACGPRPGRDGRGCRPPSSSAARRG